MGREILGGGDKGETGAGADKRKTDGECCQTRAGLSNKQGKPVTPVTGNAQEMLYYSS